MLKQRALPRDGRRRGSDGRVKASYRERSTSSLFVLAAIAIGVAIVAEAARHGGGVGYLLGVLFVALGAGRLYLLLHRR